MRTATEANVDTSFPSISDCFATVSNIQDGSLAIRESVNGCGRQTLLSQNPFAQFCQACENTMHEFCVYPSGGESGGEEYGGIGPEVIVKLAHFNFEPSRIFKKS